VLWFDALTGNVDRTWRNPNMLFWHGRLHLIDHGSSLTFHHDWKGAADAVARPYAAAQHVLIGFSPDVRAADAELAPLVTAELLRAAVDAVPDTWLTGDGPDVRDAYVRQLSGRLEARPAWLPALVEAAAAGRVPPPERKVGANRPDWTSR
jgi:hypothetical protein